MSEPKIDAKKSLCWKCKHGVCIQETEQEYLFHMGMNGGGCPNEDVDPFNLGLGAFDDSQESGSEEPIESTVQHERVKTICFWRPEGVTDSPPILVAHVKICNRFKETS